MMLIFKKIYSYTFRIITFIFSYGILLCSFSLAQYNQEIINPNSLNTWINTKDMCSFSSFDILGEKNILLGTSIDFSFTTQQVLQEGSTYLDDAKISYLLYKWTTIIKWGEGHNFSFIPQQVGEYLLKISLKKWSCELLFEEWIHVYQDVINIIGQVNEKFLDPYITLFNKENIMIHHISLEDSNKKILFWDSFEKLKKWEYIILLTDTIDNIFQGLVELTENSDFSLKNKNIIFVNTINRNLLKRIVSKYKVYLNTDMVYTTDKKNFINLIANLSNREHLSENEYLSLFSLSDTKVPSYLFLSSIVDTLIYNGFPIALIALLLTISLAVLAVSIFRQIVGFDIFGSYAPLMLGLAIHIFWFSLSGILFIFAFFATLLVRIFTKKIYLLYSAKISLLISLYFLGIFIGLSNFYSFLTSFLDFSLFSNLFIVFPMILIIFIAEKVFYEGFTFLNKRWRISIIEFSVVSYIVYLIIHSVIIQNFMLAYPEIIIAIILLIIFVGRFSGLQLLEYVRFFSLIKDEDKEE